MLRLEGCVVEAGAFRLAASLEVPAGACLAVIGPSGAGKSTLLEAVAGFRALTAGEVVWEGTRLTDLAPGKRPMAMLFQDGNLFPHLTAAENVALGIRPNGRLAAAERTAVAAALARVGLEGLGGRKPAALSGGQQSRVALARVLVQRRELLLLDEPFAALGPALKGEMLDLVAELVAETGTTLMMVSHDPEDARRIADRCVFVSEGTVTAPEPVDQFFAAQSAALRTYLGRV